MRFASDSALLEFCKATLILVLEVRNLLRGEYVAAFYFMWPIAFQDGHESRG